ncbi:formylglycine-generating enzyme family protein [Cronobacter dublinensis]
MKIKNVAFFIALISLAVAGCDDKKHEEEQKKLARQIIDSMIVVEGGRYQMGDFGPLVGEKLPFSPDADNKPLHWVELTNFKISKNRITWEQYNQWLALQRKNGSKYYEWAMDDKRSLFFKKTVGKRYPAVANWEDASSFCRWVGNVTKKNIILPTEAQWEYAARSRGKFNQFANSDNQYNPDDPDDKLNFTHDLLPVGSFPSNPLGLYDMMGNGRDWVNDWYAEDYYQHSPEKDPQGPASGTEKVVRGYLGSMFGLYDITRGSNKPETESTGYGFRCVEN